MLSVVTCKGKLRDLSPAAFNGQYLFDTNSWYFSEYPGAGDFGDYDDFRKRVASVFKITSLEVVVVGSAKLGYSLSPTKNFKPFDEDSDLDVAIVSSDHFEEIWSALCQTHYSGSPMANERTADGSISKDIFRRFITIKRDLDIVPRHLRNAAVLLDEVESKVSTPLEIKNDLNFRIYRDFKSLVSYHEWSTGKLVETL
jgi:hypothetical protein